MTQALEWRRLIGARFLPAAACAATFLFPTPEEPPMTVCPIAIAVGCKKCPAFSVCPLKSVLGDQPSKAEAEAATKKAAAGAKPRN